jgi:hypothetical protein
MSRSLQYSTDLQHIHNTVIQCGVAWLQICRPIFSPTHKICFRCVLIIVYLLKDDSGIAQTSLLMSPAQDPAIVKPSDVFGKHNPFVTPSTNLNSDMLVSQDNDLFVITTRSVSIITVSHFSVMFCNTII